MVRIERGFKRQIYSCICDFVFTLLKIFLHNEEVFVIWGYGEEARSDMPIPNTIFEDADVGVFRPNKRIICAWDVRKVCGESP